MGTITTTDGVEIFYKDWGSGQPIVFSHGWPLSADDWDTQMLFFLQRVAMRMGCMASWSDESLLRRPPLEDR